MSENAMRVGVNRGATTRRRLSCVTLSERAAAAGVLVLVSLFATAPPLASQSFDTLKAAKDTAHVTVEPLFTGRDLVYAGLFTATTIAMFPLDKKIAQNIQRPNTQANRFLRHTATAFRVTAQPGAEIIGGTLYLVGRLGHFERVADLGLHGTEAILFGTAVGFVLKGTLGRARPYAVGDSLPHEFKFGRGFGSGTRFQSFPSGHSITGFAAASAVTAETARWWPRATWLIAPVMYGGATIIALSRLYNNDHWASDALLGSAIGTFSGLKVVKYNHLHSHNRIDKILLGMTAVPTVDGGVAIAWSYAMR